MACKMSSIPADLLASLAGLPNRATAAELTTLGHPVGYTTVADHRAGRCGCRQVDVDAIVAPPADEPEAARRAPMAAPAGWQPRAEYDTAVGGFIVSPSWEA